ncbi:MAG: ABC transporter ATP-binding protein [Candidatus Methanomethylophilaceae archaeon]|nr:ABC transporter ATP-binding protein [Candidatus Methanomethylophilaceae archaeon]
MSCESPMLELEGVQFGYTKAFINLRGINLSADKGKFIALMGPNGCGKTTLMRCVNCLLKIQEGSIDIEGEDVLAMTRKQVAKVCTTVPAEMPVEFSLLLKDFVSLGRAPISSGIWWDSDEDQKAIEDIMRAFGLLKYQDRRLSQLSSGERARALVAKGVVQEPKVMMVDEPSAHLDIKYKVQVMELLKEQAKNGITVIMASHDLNLVTRYCDEAMMIKDGVIYSYGDPNEIINEQSIKDVFGIDVTVVNVGGINYVVPRPPSESDSIRDPDSYRGERTWSPGGRS